MSHTFGDLTPLFSADAGLRGRPKRAALQRPQGLPPRHEGHERPAMSGLTQRSNSLTLKGSFSAVSKPNFASKYALESSRRDLQNALLCTVLEAQFLFETLF